MPTLHAGVGLDADTVIALTAAAQNAGITSTKSGTWIRSFYQGLLPTFGKSGSKHNLALARLGLGSVNAWQSRDSAGNVDWSASTDWAAEVMREHTTGMSESMRAEVLKDAFGERGSGIASLLMQRSVQDQFDGIRKKIAGGGEIDLFSQYAENSSLQQVQQAWRDTQNLLIDIGPMALPAVNSDLRDLYSLVKAISDALAGDWKSLAAQMYDHLMKPDVKPVQDFLTGRNDGPRQIWLAAHPLGAIDPTATADSTSTAIRKRLGIPDGIDASAAMLRAYRELPATGALTPRPWWQRSSIDGNDDFHGLIQPAAFSEAANGFEDQVYGGTRDGVLDALKGGAGLGQGAPGGADDRAIRALHDDLIRQARALSEIQRNTGLTDAEKEAERHRGGGGGGSGGGGGGGSGGGRYSSRTYDGRGTGRGNATSNGPLGLGGGRPARGALAANQKEAYAAARAQGLSDKAARALVGNMSGEALSDPGNVHWDGTHYAHGIVQWDDKRAEAIKRQFGKYPQQMSVADQTKAAIWEINNNPAYPASRQALQNGGDVGSMIDTLVDNYERPSQRLRGQAKAQRRAFAQGFDPNAPVGGNGSGPGLGGAAGGGDRAIVNRLQARHCD